MNFSKHFIFVVVAVLAVFARQSDAGISNKIGSLGSAVGSRIIESISKSIAEGKRHSAYDDVKSNLEQQASQAGDNEANKIIFKGLGEVTSIFRSNMDSAYDCLKEAMDSMNTTSEEVIIQNLNTCFDATKAHIVIAGAKGYNTLGGATEISKDGARKGLNEAIQILTYGGMVSFEGLGASKDLATQGIAAGQDASEQAVKSIQTSEEAVYDFIKKAAESAFKAVNKQYSPVEEESEANLAKEKAPAGSPNCQKAMRKIEDSATKASSEVTSARKLKAIQVIRVAFVDALKTIARAEIISYNAIEEAKQIKNQKLALAVVEKAIADSKNVCVVAIAIAHQALGAVTQIIGPEIELQIIQAMIFIEASKVALFDGLENTLFIASNGIKNHLSKTALTAAHEEVEAAGAAGYGQVLKSASLALNIIVLA